MSTDSDNDFNFGLLCGFVLGLLITAMLVSLFFWNSIMTENDDEIRCETTHDSPCAKVDGEWYPVLVAP